jgi:UDP-N-acetylglucosamine--N-acetylmuramyl-(pentapeptide) pyrophosphoryl-undecaprenol N-acetylglucosamine transferase
MLNERPKRSIAIACGGTGGHFFPGLAVAEKMDQRGWTVTLLISPKEVDQHAVRAAGGFEVVILPAVALDRGSRIAFLRGFFRSYRESRRRFEQRKPDAVIAMGGFISAPPILAGRRAGARTFLHESNAVPGRASRWLARLVDEAFVGFPEAAARLRSRKATVTGTPVRTQFQPRNAAECRPAFGLEPERPVLLVMGGSQGASGINELVLKALLLLTTLTPELQWLHLTGPREAERVSAAYAELGLKSVVRAFCAEMHLALGAATVAISRAGASSLAELAAVQVPAILIPFPAATGNHQFHNARAFETAGAARLLEQCSATPELLSRVAQELVQRAEVREKMRAALGRLHAPRAADDIAEAITNSVAAEHHIVNNKSVAASSPVHRYLSAIT